LYFKWKILFKSVIILCIFILFVINYIINIRCISFMKNEYIFNFQFDSVYTKKDCNILIEACGSVMWTYLWICVRMYIRVCIHNWVLPIYLHVHLDIWSILTIMDPTLLSWVSHKIFLVRDSKMAARGRKQKASLL
jgi:hypothetical protein